jgi:hypothetical protein
MFIPQSLMDLVDQKIAIECEKPYSTNLKSFFNHYNIQSSDSNLRASLQGRFLPLIKAHKFSGYKKIESKILNNKDFKALDKTNTKYMISLDQMVSSTFLSMETACDKLLQTKTVDTITLEDIITEVEANERRNNLSKIFSKISFYVSLSALVSSVIFLMIENKIEPKFKYPYIVGNLTALGFALAGIAREKK